MRPLLLVALSGLLLLPALDAQMQPRVRIADPGVRDGPLKAKEPEPEQPKQEPVEMTEADRAFFRKLDEKLRQYMPDSQLDTNGSASSSTASTGQTNAQGETTSSDASTTYTPAVDFVLPAFEVSAVQIEDALLRDLLRQSQTLYTEEGWEEAMIKKHLSELDRELLNKWTLPWGESAAARAARLEQYEQDREWEHDMKDMLNTMEDYDLPETDELRDEMSEDFYLRR